MGLGAQDPLAEITAVVEHHRQRIAAILPGAAIFLSGSASVPGLSPNDLDFVALVSDVRDATTLLKPHYLPLYEEAWRDDWAAFRESGPPQVDLVVTVPGSRGDAHHRLVWEVIASESELLAEYQELKASPDDYEQRKKAFFTRVVARLEAPGWTDAGSAGPS